MMSCRVELMGLDWANLPEHLLYLILERFEFLSDFVRFSVVCTSWLCVAKDNRKLAEMLSRRQPPMLLIASDKKDTWNVYNFMHDKVLDMQIRLPTNRFCGSSKGWLVMVEKDFSVTLVNPFSGVVGIRLPPLPFAFVNESDGYVNKVMISADPITNPEDCVVAVTYQSGPRKVSFISLSQDTAWTHVDSYSIGSEEVVYAGDICYAVGAWNKLISFDITTRSTLYVKKLSAPGGYIKRYLVDVHEKKLMMLQRYILWVGEKLRTQRFKIFEMSFEKSEWVEKETLGDDVSLFVGNTNTISIAASSFPTCQPDCIYFNQDNSYLADIGIKSLTISVKSHDDFGVYNVKTKSISRPFTRDAMTLVKKTKLPPIWVAPTFSCEKLQVLRATSSLKPYP